MLISTNKKPKLMLIIFISALGIISCNNKPEGNPDSNPVASCEGCHTNYAHLQQVYTPDTIAPVGGCGGDAPHFEPFDRVYMGGEGYEEYKQSAHYAIGCTECHGGTNGTDDKGVAHSVDFISHPSMFYEEKCAACHASITEHFTTSIHNGTGQKRKVAIRSGLSGPEDFDLLPEHQIEGYNNNCATCHGTCGNCHVVRPPIAGGGLSKGHSFNKTPDMLNVCVKCHTSRGGHAYLGVALGTKPDVHLTGNDDDFAGGFQCLDCHNGNEMHGDGNPVEQRYDYNKLPTCEDCHADIGSANSYHTMHMGDFNCQVCHSQDYNNCGQCHIGASEKSGPGAQIPSYLGFKIAKNPIPDVKPGFGSGLVLVRRTLAAPENWDAFVSNAYPNFNALPTYNFTTPHNILRWTIRTNVEAGKSCSSNCHIGSNGENKEFYLFQEDLLEWELDASTRITVDDVLPASWPKN